MRVKALIYSFLMIINVFCLVKAESKIYTACSSIQGNDSEQRVLQNELICQHLELNSSGLNHIPRY